MKEIALFCDTPMRVVEPKLTALGLAVNRLLAADSCASASVEVLAGNAELQPDNNTLSKITKTLRHRIPLLLG